MIEIEPSFTEPTVYTAKLPMPTTSTPYPVIGRYLAVGLTLAANGVDSTSGDITFAIDLVGRDA